MACRGKLEIYYVDGKQTGEWRLICEGDCSPGNCSQTYVTGYFGKARKPATRVFCGCVEAGTEPEEVGECLDEIGRDEPEECHIFLGLQFVGRPAKIHLHPGCIGSCVKGKNCGETRDHGGRFGKVSGLPKERIFIRPEKLANGTSRAIEVREYTCPCA